jgi:hypothetical protein
VVKENLRQAIQQRPAPVPGAAGAAGDRRYG